MNLGIALRMRLWMVRIGLLLCCAAAMSVPARGQAPVQVIVVDETGAAVPGAVITVEAAGTGVVHLSTDFSGRATYAHPDATSYRLHIQKAGFYQSDLDESDPSSREIRVVLTHVQMLVQQVDVNASPAGIDPQQISDKFTLDAPAIINVPYPTSRDIRNLLTFFPGVVQDSSGQVHIAGSDTWATLDMLDGFDIRSPMGGSLSMRFSADAVRSIEEQATRYPVEYGRSTGGVLAFSTGMGDNKFRFNATNFIPSFQQKNGLRFDKFVPRVTVSGPMRRDRAWFFDGLETEFDQIYVKELPADQNTNFVARGSNLFRVQVNAGPRRIVQGGALFNDYHSLYDGLSPLAPRTSTTKRNTIAWLPYGRLQQTMRGGALLDVGVGLTRFRDGYRPHAGSTYTLTPELSQGAYFERMDSRSQRVEGNAMLYLPPRRWRGRHDFKIGIDLDHIDFSEIVVRTPIRYLREDGTLLRLSTFPAAPAFERHNVEAGAYVQDRWSPNGEWLIEPGLRFDWDEIVRKPLWSPRIAGVFTPGAAKGATKLSAGVGVYYEHTQLEYLARALAGTRTDTYYAADGSTQTGPPLQTVFTFDPHRFKEAYALNWSAGLEQRLPGAVYLKAEYMRKHVLHHFVYANESAPAALSGTYTLTNAREDRDSMVEVEARRSFKGSYTLFGSYVHSSAHTNAVLDYTPTLSFLGGQQGGPLPWDSPNRVISWGWAPFLIPGFRKHWDFVYTLDWHTGFPYTAVNANREVVGTANDRRFPNYIAFDPGLEWKFHLRGMYLGLRGVMENATNATDPYVVNNVTDSPQFGAFSSPAGRAFTARIRLIESKK